MLVVIHTNTKIITCYARIYTYAIYFLVFTFSRLEESGVVTECQIKTFEANETLDFDFAAANITNKIIMKVSSYHNSCDQFASYNLQSSNE